MDIEFDFKGDPVGGVITNCKYYSVTSSFCVLLCLMSNQYNVHLHIYIYMYQCIYANPSKLSSTVVEICKKAV